MNNINWNEEVAKRKDELIKETQRFLEIESVLSEKEGKQTAPFGEGIEQSLQFLLHKGKSDGFVVKNVDHYAGHIEYGDGNELVGVLCHVDVVPAGDGWTSPPFSAEIRDGKIYARGAMDDKGPTMAAYYALKIVKELGLPLSKRVRIIIGTDEESEWRCVDHYFKKEEMPTIGFAPDADFPIIYAEKGIGDIEFKYELIETKEENETIKLQEFASGQRLNMVPDYAKAILQSKSDTNSIVEAFEKYVKKHSLIGKVEVEERKVEFEIKGVSAHAMEPNNGVNAGHHLTSFLTMLNLDSNGEAFLGFIENNLSHDSRGGKLNISYTDDITGDLTVNTGLIHYQASQGGKIGVNIRFPVTCKVEDVEQQLTKVALHNQFVLSKYNVSPPHHVAKDHPLIQTLQKVYEEQTGEEAKLLSIGGGTYARSLEAGVAFGPLFPGREDVAHQKDEYIYIEDLLKATAIYAQAIYELAK